MSESHNYRLSWLLAIFMLLVSIPHTTQLKSSQAWSLLGLRHLLNNPPILSGWNTYTDPCYSDSSPSPTVVCYEEGITQLQINGEPGSPPLPKSFNVDSFFTTLTRLPDLKVLKLSSLGLWGALPSKIWRLSKLEILNLSSNYLSGPIPREISLLKNLQTLILDNNSFSGGLSNWLGEFPLLAVLSLRNNSLNGSLPDSVATLENLRVLTLSGNNLLGELPDLTGLSNLQVLDLEDNEFGPRFPVMQRKVVTVVLKNNRFTGAIPSDVDSYYLLRHLDVSQNRFVGPLPTSVLNLPSIRYLNVAGNSFTGMLFENMSCNYELEFVDISSNLLTGNLPVCLKEKSNKNVTYAMNCLANEDQDQHPFPFCQREALAVGFFPREQKKALAHKAIVVASVVFGLLAGIALIAILGFFFGLRKMKMQKAMKRPPRRLVEHASTAYPSKLLSDARYISQTMKLGALGIPAYKSLSLEDLQAATNNFHAMALMGEGSHGQMYKGKLKDGSFVAIRCLKLRRSHSAQNFTRHIELIAKLRHRHLVSALGHCFEYYLEDSTVSRLFLVFEYIPNGTLRSHICEGVDGQKLTWTQRISVAIGVAKGIEFLHSGIIPGLFANNLKSINVLLDPNFVAKISSYNIPIVSEVINPKQRSKRQKHEDKIDIYDFGTILLEMITGKPVSFETDMEKSGNQLQSSIAADGVVRKKGLIDPAVSRACSNESLRTVIGVCIRCLSSEPTARPSVEDVLWNLQFAAQVQDAWRGDSQSSDGSMSPKFDLPL